MDQKKKGKQFKVGITERGFEELNKFLNEANKDSRKKIKTPEVLEQAVGKLKSSDILAIQERVYTADDKMEVMLEEYNRRHPERLMTKEELKVSMVEMFDKQILSKMAKNLKMGQESLRTNTDGVQQDG